VSPGDPWLFAMTCFLGMNVGMTTARAQNKMENNNNNNNNNHKNNNHHHHHHHSGKIPHLKKEIVKNTMSEKIIFQTYWAVDYQKTNNIMIVLKVSQVPTAIIKAENMIRAVFKSLLKVITLLQLLHFAISLKILCQFYNQWSRSKTKTNPTMYVWFFPCF